MKVRALNTAKSLGISFGELIRSSLAAFLDRSNSSGQRDYPFLSDDAIYTGPAPSDLSERHDYYLYDADDP